MARATTLSLLSFSIRGISEAGIVWLFYWRGSNLRDITREKFCEESNPYLFQTENTAYLHDLKNIATQSASYYPYRQLLLIVDFIFRRERTAESGVGLHCAGEPQPLMSQGSFSCALEGWLINSRLFTCRESPAFLTYRSLSSGYTRMAT